MEKEIKSVISLIKNKFESRNLPEAIEEKLENVGREYGLSGVERGLLLLFVMMEIEYWVMLGISEYGVLNGYSKIRALAMLLGVSEDKMKSLLQPDGKLIAKGLVRIDYEGLEGGTRNYYDAFLLEKTLLKEFFPIGNVDCHGSDEDIANLIQLVKLKKSNQFMDSIYGKTTGISKLKKFIRVLMSLPRFSNADSWIKGRAGVNVLLYGVAGIGKNECVRSVSVEIGVELIEIKGNEYWSGEREPLEDGYRIKALFNACYAYDGYKAILLIQRALDNSSENKLITDDIISLMESNATPVFWVERDVSKIDPSIMQRFDMVVEMKLAGNEGRKKLLEEMCVDLVSCEVIDRLSTQEKLTPAIVKRAVNVIKMTKGDLEPEEISRFFEELVVNALRVQNSNQ